VRQKTRGALRIAAVAAAAGLVLAACGGGDINSGASNAASDCGAFNIAVNPWVGYEASAYVVGTIAQTRLGCDVSYKNLKEEVSWQGMNSGDIDVVLENWGHEDLEKKYIDEQKTVVNLGPDGNIGIIGWYVPPWLAKAHPDVLQYQNLNKYASEFATPESDGKGQLLDGDPSYVTNDEALVTNLGLNFKVVYAGSEDALIAAFKKAEQDKTWMIGYFYEPQWFFSEVDLQQVALPKYTPGCDTPPSAVDCAYPKYILNKVARADFMNENGPAAQFVKAWKWTNDDQNTVAGYIAKDGMDPTAAAQKWIDANPDKVDAWLQGIPQVSSSASSNS
jgi:glycine betaine/proline transport system substrate-binding protein